MTETHDINHETVMAWIDGELPPHEARQVASHVETCAPCRQLVADLRAVSVRLGAWSVPPAPADLRAPAIPARVTPVRRPWAILARLPRWSYAVGAAATIVVAMVAMQTLQYGGLGMQEPFDVRSARAYDMAADSPPPSSYAHAPATPPLPAATSRSMDRMIDYADRAPRAESQTPARIEMIVRTAAMEVFTEKFDEARAALEQLVRAHDGSVARLQVTGHEPSRRTLSASVRVPNARMDSAMAAIRQIGKVRQETQSSDDVTDAFRDLSVRLANARIEERRLNDLLARRTGNLADVLAVEQEVMRVRGQIEQMDAETRDMQGRAAQSTITVKIDETYRADLATGPEPLATRMSNALVDGMRGALGSLEAVTIALLTIGPALLAWGTLLALPAWWIVRRVRRSPR